MAARYLLRFDDLCPTVPWPLWDELEALLVETGVQPLLAVIPDNLDPKLHAGPASPRFWDRVRTWQARGWSIGLHGYQHVYVNREPGLLGLNRQSEFAGLTLEAQLDKLRRGLAIFEREGVTADAWVAPAHSFDAVTLAALASLGLDTISDGMALGPYRDAQGLLWVPQQFANLRPMPCGLWTFCYHLEDLTPPAMITFRARLAQLAPHMLSLRDAAAMAHQGRNAGDEAVAALRRAVSSLNRVLGR
jgi:peptidoglycan/xylan/chitin deacetylase (PgdA/CDA1 family)